MLNFTEEEEAVVFFGCILQHKNHNLRYWCLSDCNPHGEDLVSSLTFGLDCGHWCNVLLSIN